VSSFSSLYVGYSGLNAAQRAVEVAAHNVANAGTTGYTRQRLAVHTAMPTPGTDGLRGDGMRGTGVNVMSIDRLRDRLADVSWRSEAGVEAVASARSDALSRTETALGSYADGAPEQLSSFLSAWDGLSRTPSDSAARSTVLSSGEALAAGLRSSAASLTAVGTELGARIGDSVGELNGLLTQVATLNVAIERARVAGSDPNDLYDSRDNALDRITQLTGATVAQGDGDTVTVSVGDVALVDGPNAHAVSAEGTGADTALSVDGQAIAPGGSLGGQLSVLKVDLPDYSSRLDAIAVGLRDAVNAVHSASTDLNGNPGGPFFTGDGAADLSVADLTEAQVAVSRTGQAQDGEGALAMSALRTSAAVGTATVSQALVAFGSRVGQAVTDATRAATTAKSGLDSATLSRSSVDGVNVDEEMVDLVKYQHSYSAASRVISVVDSMLDEIINKMGH
jgi:flagellar hook-associated protein 1 FlgK